MILAPNRPITNALRFTIHCSYHVLLKTISFSIPTFNPKDRTPIVEHLAKKLLSYLFKVGERTVTTYVDSFSSYLNPPCRPDTYYSDEGENLDLEDGICRYVNVS